MNSLQSTMLLAPSTLVEFRSWGKPHHFTDRQLRRATRSMTPHRRVTGVQSHRESSRGSCRRLVGPHYRSRLGWRLDV